MKMSQAMIALGYGALPGGENLIREEQQRESGQKPVPKTSDDLNCFSFSVPSAVEDDDDIELVIEITNVEPPDKSVGYHGSIEIEAYTLRGRSFELTALEHERAIESAIKHMAKWYEDTENALMDR